MSLRICLLLAAAGCQGSGGAAPGKTAPAEPTLVELHDGSAGSGPAPLVASVRPGHPCRAMVDGEELFVGGPPLVAQVGSAHWTGEDRDRSTLIEKDGAAVARLLDNGDDLSVVDPQGIPFVHIVAKGDSATIADRSSRLVRTVARHADKVAIEGTAQYATGTRDLVVVALLSAPELTPEVRMLSACRRVLREVP